MKLNKKTVALFGISMLALGSVGSIAVRSFAQTGTSSQIQQLTPVIQQKQDGKDMENGKETLDAKENLKASIKESDAVSMAEKAYPGTKAVKTQLENENGIAVYGVELNNNTDVKIDANSGKILKAESGNDKNEKENVEAKENTKEKGSLTENSKESANDIGPNVDVQE